MSTKPKASRCSTCGAKVEPWLRLAAISRGVVVFPEKWMTSDTCSTCEGKVTAAQEAGLRDRLTRERLARAGLGEPRLQSMEFKGYLSDTPARERVASMVRPAYKELVRRGSFRNMTFSGTAGQGKTHMAVSFARAALARGLRTRFCPWTEMMLKMREASLSNKHLVYLEEIMRNEVLVLDDIGADSVTEFVVQNLYLIVDKWWRLEKPGLIVTTNLAINEIGRVYGDRVASRLAGMSLLVDFEGCPDARIEASAVQENLNFKDKK